MKNNQPVTNVEYVLKETDSIVSKTDLKGVITYINEDFLRVSGFAESELIGISHNLVRHPDMPTEAFADLWDALKANRPWTGLVKNRCKNGDFYWVVANVTPIYESGQCTGYLSVRSKPSQQQISAASSAYALFRNGQAGGMRIKNGNIAKSGLLEKLNLLKNVSIKFRMALVLLAMVALQITVSGNSVLGMTKDSEGLRTIYEDRAIPLSQLGEIKTKVLHIRTAIVTGIAFNKEIPKQHEEIGQDLAEITRLLNILMAANLSMEEKKQADQFAGALQQCISRGVNPTMELQLAGKYEESKQFYWEHMRPICKPVTEGVNALVTLQLDATRQEYQDSLIRNNNAKSMAISLAILGLLMAAWELLTVFRGVVAPLEKTIALLRLVSQGKYDNAIVAERQDEVGQLMNALKSMQIKLGFDVAEAQRMANENLRIRIGLDNVSTSVMISDVGRKIIYINKSAGELMQIAEADIRKVLPSFSAAKLLGSSVDDFHRNPAHQKAMIESLSSTHRTQIEVGGRTFALALSPVINDRGLRLGSVLEWKDRTAEVVVEKEVAQIVNAAVQGDFTQRIDMLNKEGFFKQLGTGINQLMATSDRGLQEVVQMLGALARGDLTHHISNEYHGTFGQLKDDANATSDRLREIISQIKVATDTINTAAKEISSGNTDLSQRTEEQASSLEETAASMEQLTSTVKQNSDNAKQANQLAHSASSVAEKGGAVVREVVGTMSSINESSRKIVDIISVIDGIAFQTNILALNAAVEAARAGEQGRGFAVVASEVRNLAQRSAAAAKEIKILISGSVQEVEAGSKLVDDAGKTMEGIVNAVKRVTDIMSDISAASAEQSQGIEQVNTAIAQMDEVTQQNAALVEEAAAAAESLEEEAQNLNRSVSIFKMDGVQQVRSSAPRAVVPSAPKPVSSSARKTAVVSPAKPKALPGKKTDEQWEEF